MTDSRPTFAFHNLDVHRIAKRFTIEALDIARHMPRGRAKLADQLRRAAESTLLNIGEGAARRSPRDKAHRYVIAQSECTECAAALELIEIRRLASAAAVLSALHLAARVCQMLEKLIQRFE